MTAMASVTEFDTTIVTPDGSMSAFVAHPDGGEPAPVVVVYQDAIGFRDVHCDVARRLASNGYFAIVPDLYYRWGERISFDPLKMRSDLDMRAQVADISTRQSDDDVLSDTGALLAYVASEPAAGWGPKGCIGFCMGGRHVVRSMAAFPDEFLAGSSLHPSFLVTDQPDSPHFGVGSIAGELYIGYGADDTSHLTEDVQPVMSEALDRHGVRHSHDVYAGAGHGYMLPGNVGYEATAAEASWQRTLELFGRALGGASTPAAPSATDDSGVQRGLNVLDPAVLRALNDARVALGELSPLDPRTTELVNVAALIAVAAPASGFRTHIERAVHAGATAEEIWGVVASIALIVGVPKVSQSAPAIQAALEQATLEQATSPGATGAGAATNSEDQ